MAKDKKTNKGNAGEKECLTCEVPGDYMCAGTPSGRPEEDSNEQQ